MDRKKMNSEELDEGSFLGAGNDNWSFCAEGILFEAVGIDDFLGELGAGFLCSAVANEGF